MSNEEVIEILSEQRARGFSMKLPYPLHFRLKGFRWRFMGYLNSKWWEPFDEFTQGRAISGQFVLFNTHSGFDRI